MGQGILPQALSADSRQLACRGMATEDPQGDISWRGKRYKQVLQDYPYADDGMLIWNALHDWVSAYVKVCGPEKTFA